MFPKVPWSFGLLLRGSEAKPRQVFSVFPPCVLLRTPRLDRSLLFVTPSC